MENKELYYEALNVSDEKQVKAAYDYAVAHNKKYYRCKSKSNRCYYWNGSTYKQLTDGKEWAENPLYKEPVKETATKPVVANSKPQPQKTNADYKVLYEKALPILSKTQAEAANNLKLYLQTKKQYDELVKALTVIKQTIENSQNTK